MPVCVLQVALEGEGEDFLPKAWGKFHWYKPQQEEKPLCMSSTVCVGHLCSDFLFFVNKARTASC